MGPTIQLGYMGHLWLCLIGRDAQCYPHYHPGPLYIIWAQRWSIHQSFSQSPGQY